MRTLAFVLTTAALLVSSAADPAAQRPRASPHETVGNTVDGAELKVVYGRPYMRGRVIFGSLIPYGTVWCPGADEATMLQSTRDLQLGDLKVPKGSHTIWILPTADKWTLVVSNEPDGFHTNYHSDADLGRVELTKRMLDAPVDQLTFAITPASAGGGTIAMSWEKTEVSIPFKVLP